MDEPKAPSSPWKTTIRYGAGILLTIGTFAVYRVLRHRVPIDAVQHGRFLAHAARENLPSSAAARYMTRYCYRQQKDIKAIMARLKREGKTGRFPTTLYEMANQEWARTMKAKGYDKKDGPLLYREATNVETRNKAGRR